MVLDRNKTSGKGDRLIINSTSFSHMPSLHYPCHRCNRYFESLELLDAHCEMPGHTRIHGNFRHQPPPAPAVEKIVPDYYAFLNIHPQSSHDEIVKAAKEMRIATHADRLKRVGVLLSAVEERRIDERAALVGQAADVLLNETLRRKYDSKMGV